MHLQSPRLRRPGSIRQRWVGESDLQSPREMGKFSRNYLFLRRPGSIRRRWVIAGGKTQLLAVHFQRSFLYQTIDLIRNCFEGLAVIRQLTSLCHERGELSCSRLILIRQRWAVEIADYRKHGHTCGEGFAVKINSHANCQL